MPKYTEIFLIRHAEAVEKKDTDPDDNVPLNAKGRDQSERTGKYLEQYSTKPKVDAMMSSQLIRAVETSDIIAEEIGYKGKIDRLKILNEYNWDWDRGERKKVNIIADKLTEEYNEKYKNDPIGYYKNFHLLVNYKFPADIKPPTTVAQLRAKVKKFLKDLTKTKHRKIVIVTHHHVISMMTALITGLDMQITTRGQGTKPAGNCAITYIKLEDGRYTIVAPISTSHLEQ